MELTLKQYAQEVGVSYEAVRSSFALHKDTDLIEGTHYRKAGRQRMLTDAGIQAMNEYRQRPIMILPSDTVAMNDELFRIRSQVESLEAEISGKNAEIAELNLRITELEHKLEERNESLIEALFRLQEAQGRLLTAAETPPQKQGFFARLFAKK